MFTKLLAPHLIIPFVAKTLGVPTGPLQQLIGQAEKDVAATSGTQLAVVPALSAMMDGDFSWIRELYDNVLANEALRPGIASVAARWLEQHDTDHIAIKAMGFVSDLPLHGMGRDFDSVESFLLEGFFPLLDEFFSPRDNCPLCEGPLQSVAPTLLLCADCGQYKDN